MKSSLSLLILAALSATAFADIQDPPGNDFGPTRKLSRGLANMFFGVAEVFQTPCEIQAREGNSAAWSYGPIRGFGRFFFRFGAGIWEVASFPVPTNKGSYRPPYKMDPPWIHGGYEEFPPELGFESRFDYVRDYNGGF